MGEVGEEDAGSVYNYTWLGLRRTEVQQNNILTFYGSLNSSTYGSVKDLACWLIVVRIRQHILV